MKNTNKQNLTVNVLILLLLALFFLTGSLMWSQHNQYHNKFWGGQSTTLTSPSNHMNWLNPNESR